MGTEGPIKKASERVHRIVEQIYIESGDDKLDDPESPICKFQEDWNVCFQSFDDSQDGHKGEFWDEIIGYLFKVGKPSALYVEFYDGEYEMRYIKCLIDATEEELIAAYPDPEA